MKVPERIVKDNRLVGIQQDLRNIIRETPSSPVMIGAKKTAKDLESLTNRIAVNLRKTENKLLKENITFRNSKKKLLNDFKAKTKGLESMKRDVLRFARENLGKNSDQFKVIARELNELKTRGNQLNIFKRVIKARNEVVRNTAITTIKDVVRDIGRLPISTQEKIAKEMSGLKLENFGDTTQKRLEGLRDFLEKNPERIVDFQANKSIKDLSRIAELDKKSIDKLSMEELQKLSARLEFLRKEGTAIKGLLEGRTVKGQRFEGLHDLQVRKETQELIETASNLDRGTVVNEIGKDLTKEQKWTNRLWNTARQLQKGELNYSSVDNVMEILDGIVSGGAHSRLIKQRIDDALDFAEDARVSFNKKFVETRDAILKKHNIEEFTQGAWERIGIHAILMQEKGIRKLRNSGVPEEVIQASKKLSAPEKEMYDFMRVTLDELEPQIDSVMRSTGQGKLDKVKNYFPTRPEFEVLEKGEGGQTVSKMMLENYNRKNLEKGFTKQRTAFGGKYILNAQDLFLKHINDATYFVHTEEPLRHVGKIVSDKKYREAIGEIGSKYMDGYVDIIARKGTPQGYQYNWFDVVKRNIGAATLGFNPSVIIKQPLALLTGSSFLGKHSIIHQGEFHKNYKALRKAIDKASAQQRVRALDDPAYTELSLNGKLAKAQELGYRGIKVTDKYTADNVWYGAYKKYFEDVDKEFNLDKFLKGEVDDEARKYADKLVRVTQGTGKFKDLPAMLTGKNKKLLTTIFQYQSFVLNQSQILTYHAIRKATIKEKNIAKAGAIVSPLVLMAILEDRIDVTKAEIYGSKEYRDRLDERSKAEYAIDLGLALFPPANIVANLLEPTTGVPVWDTTRRTAQATAGIFTAEKTETKVKNAEKVVEGGFSLFGIPGSGFTGTVSRRLIEEGFETPAEKLAMALESGDRQTAYKVIREAEDDGLNTKKIVEKAKASVTRKKTAEAKETAEKLIPQIKKSNNKSETIKKLRDEGILTPEVEKQMKNILSSKQKSKELGE